jgi:ferredoxin-type protein NapH
MKNNILSILLFAVFFTVGIIVAIVRHDYKYFWMFGTIGLLSSGCEYLINSRPKLRQLMRLTMLTIIGGSLFGFLSLYRGVSFQFPQIFFDASAGIVTGALIQLVVARVALPFIFGNAFCSRACWNGIVFELIYKSKIGPCHKKPRLEIVAWTYLVSLIILACIVTSITVNPAENETIRKWWIVGENVWIVVLGLVLTMFLGGRAYCRTLCPFITISGLFSRFSILKITPIQRDKCVKCTKCSKACPMGIDVMSFVVDGRRVNNKTCILCERCVSACATNCLKMQPGNPLK